MKFYLGERGKPFRLKVCGANGKYTNGRLSKDLEVKKTELVEAVERYSLDSDTLAPTDDLQFNPTGDYDISKLDGRLPRL